jgi:NDP-sugar pyrophosphorylase family protein
MRAIILAENSHCELSSLTNHIPHALLPLAGKPLLLHALEVLHRSSIHDVEVVAPQLHEQLESGINMGPLLGMEVTFTPRMPEMVDRRESSLVIGLRTLADINWNEVFDELGELELHTPMPIRMVSGGLPVALMVPPGFDGTISSDWLDIHHTEAVLMPVSTEAMVQTGSISEYYEANFSILKMDFKYLTPAGREFTSGHRAGPRARVNRKSILTTQGYFGSNSKVDKSASLMGGVILGDNVIVDRGARVSDSIILDSTYIGINTDCKRAIVSGGLMVKVDSGVSLELNDPVLLGAI